MTLLKHLFAVFILFVFSSSAFAAQQFSPKGLSGHAGAGYSKFTAKEPATDIKFDQGQFATLGGEKGLGILNLYLTFGFNYLSTEGLLKYEYSTLAGDTYDANDVKFKLDIFQAALGLKFKIIDGFFFKPYVEGGGVFGYYNLDYKPSTSQKADLDADAGAKKEYKLKDSILDFGNYAEAGVDVAFSDSFALKLAGRLQRSKTKDVDTFKKRTIDYETEIYYLTVLKSF